MPTSLLSPCSCRVYKALLHGDLVAAKEVEIGDAPGMRELFLAEASKLAQLRHPHVITLFGLSLTPDKGVVFMELCEGEGPCVVCVWCGVCV